MKKENIKPNKKIVVIVLISVLLMTLTFTVSIKADWTEDNVLTNVENLLWLYNDQNGIDSYNNQIFYEEDIQRWYILYSYDASSIDIYLRYAYSDVDDISSWTTGGTITGIGYIRTIPHGGQPPNTQYAWCYDNENDLGHLVFALDYSASTPYGLKYRNFTIDSGTGSITFGSVKELITQSSGNCFPSVDIALSYSNLPIIGYGGYYYMDGNACSNCTTLICDSTDGYNGNWEAVYFTQIEGYSAPVIIPTGNESCITINLSLGTDNPAKYYEIDFNSPSNSSGTGTSLTSDSVATYNYANSLTDVWGFGVTYNTTHGFITYCNTSFDAQVFWFDFETMTISSEYNIATYPAYYYASNCITMNNNEAFVICQYTTPITTFDRDILCCEMVDSSYEGYFNVSATDYILEDYTTTWSNYSPKGITVSRHSNSENVSLLMVHNGEYVSVTSTEVIGEFATEEPIEEPEVENNLIFIFGGVATFLIIFWLIIKAKKGD